MQQIDLIRRYSLRKVRELKSFISCLPTREEEAMKALDGSEGVKTAARIADFILSELGHPAPNFADDSPTVKAARQVVGSSRRT